jgi:hypothetical protein
MWYKRALKSIVFVGIILFLTTCTYKAMDPNVCFTENVLPIFVSKCSMSGCHSPGSRRMDLSNYDGIMNGVVAGHPLRSNVYTEISGANPSMPPRDHTQLTSQEVYYIKVWISMGAFNQTNCTVVCDSTTFKFGADIQPLINSQCVGCHSPSSAGGGDDLSTYSGVVNSIANNQLLGSVEHSSGYSPMPQNGGQLSACDISKIKSWISAGHPND